MCVLQDIYPALYATAQCADDAYGRGPWHRLVRAGVADALCECVIGVQDFLRHPTYVPPEIPSTLSVKALFWHVVSSFSSTSSGLY